jgi:hypothetical protein
VSRRLWSTRSNAERSAIHHRSMPIEQATCTETGVLHFDEYGRKQVKLSRNEIDKEIQELTVNDPTNFNARVAAATAENAAWHRAHPSNWAGTTGCNPQNETERRALADAQAASTRDLTYAEKQQIIDKLRQR